MKDLEHVWTKDVKSVLAHFNVTELSGLSSAQILSQQQIYGKNELPEEPPTPIWTLIFEQFKDTLVLILLGSAIVSFVLAFFEEHDSLATAFVEPLVILFILIGNATVGVIQETKAEQAINALQEYSPESAKAVRNGHVDRVQSTDLVPGDVIALAVGDKIPADARVISISSSSFTVDQALLTGESVSVNKTPEVVPDKRAVKQDMINMLFSGTTVANGNAHAVVTATATNTAIGNIHTSISEQISEKTPLKIKLDEFGEQLAKVITVICVLVWIVNVRHFGDPSHGGWVKGAVYYLKIAVALAVAAIPEGLAAVITACLALGTQKMARRGAIVRNLPSVETLGCTNVICADKTGTLTTNQMSVSRFAVAMQGKFIDFEVQGTTFAPNGEVRCPQSPQIDLPSCEPVHQLCEIAAICNDSSIAYDEEHGTYQNIGEPTEAALKVMVEKITTNDSSFNKKLTKFSKMERTNAVTEHLAAKSSRILTFEFSRDRKSMSVLVRRRDGSGALLVKGAPESILDRCTHIVGSSGTSIAINNTHKREIKSKIATYGEDGLRTLAFAYLDVTSTNADDYKSTSSAEYIKFEQNMTFVGLAGMLDPPRPEVRQAVLNCRSAGIRVIVITGDNKATAESICRSIGIFSADESLTGKSFTGRELENMSHSEKITAVKNASLFSRTEPLHKSELVDLLQSLGLVVAMTGDGVNDAVALKKANIGIAMGSGTDVATLASDMVLVDDNFATIEKAVEEGRAIYNNTKQFIRYLISSNIGEVVSIFLTVLLGMPEALIPVQLLWLNLVTDGLPATALGFNPPDHTIMRTPPRSSSERLIGGWLFVRYMIVGVYVGVATVAAYAVWFMYYVDGPHISWYQLTHFHECSSLFPEIGCQIFTNEMAKKATTMSLSTLVTIEMFNALNSLSENESLLVLPPWRNLYVIAAIVLSMILHFMILYVPFLASLFVITPLNWAEWKIVLALSFPVILIDEVLKLITINFIDIPARIKTE